MSTWLIRVGGTDYTPASLKLSVVGGEWVSGGPSAVTLRALRKFDAAELFSHGTAITLKRDGSNYFQGKVRAIPKSATGSSEAQEYIIQDAWVDLERLTYQEPWKIRQTDFNGVAYSPRVVLGMDSGGDRISTSAQIAEAVAFAAARGVSIQAGSIPTGMMLWPEEQNGLSCAEVIRTSLRYHLDWMPWLDHSTSPPSLNITPAASATARTLSVSGSAKVPGFTITETPDRVPTGVRIIYKSCHVTDSPEGDGKDVFRTFRVDQAPYPTGTATQVALALTGPAPLGMLVTEVELEGGQTQIQKQQVTVREIPTNQEDAKAYLRKKFAIPAAITDAKFNVTEWERFLVDESEDETPPVLDTKLERQVGESLTGVKGLKNELIDGSIPDWIQRSVGKVLIRLSVEGTGTATEEDKKILSQIPPWFIITATNATTKIYKGVSSFTAGATAPDGVAAAYLAALTAGCNYSGTITVRESDVGATRWHGSRLNLTGGVSAWASMDAPIHSVSWDLRTRQSQINFGPNPDFGIQDYIEFLRNLSKRELRTFTKKERDSAELGDDEKISGRGDSVGPTMTPQTITGGGSGGSFAQPFQLVASGTAGDTVLRVRESTLAGAVPSGFTAGFKEFTISASGVIYAKLTINATTGAVTARTIENATTLPTATYPAFHEQIGSYTVTGTGEAAVISATNTRYGPVQATICRYWYAAATPYFGVTFS